MEKKGRNREKITKTGKTSKIAYLTKMPWEQTRNHKQPILHKQYLQISLK